MVTKKAVDLFGGIAEVHPWWENGDAKQVNNA